MITVQKQWKRKIHYFTFLQKCPRIFSTSFAEQPIVLIHDISESVAEKRVSLVYQLTV